MWSAASLIFIVDSQPDQSAAPDLSVLELRVLELRCPGASRSEASYQGIALAIP